MSVVKKEIDTLNAVLTVSLKEEDYISEVDKVLKDYRKKANIPGFRPGKIPMGMIKKMYRTSILVDEVNKKVSNELYTYIYSEKLDTLGDPIPSENEQKIVDWEKDKEFEFSFDIALAPQFDLNLTKKDKVVFYDIIPGDDLIKNYIDGYKKQFGSYEEKDTVESEEEMLKGDFEELVDGGIKKEEAVFLMSTIKIKKAQKVFLSKKKGTSVEFKIKDVFSNDADIKSMLAIDDSKLETAKESVFKFTIKSISVFKEADLDTNLFDKVFEKGTIKTEEEFKNKIIEQAKVNLAKDADYKFNLDVKEKLLKKAKFDLPDAFLKRWLVMTNKEITAEQLEKEYPMFQEDMKWQLVKGKIVKDHKIETSEEEILEVAKEYAKAQFQMYGSVSIPDEYLESFAKEMLQKKEEKRRLEEKAIENKVVAFVKETVKLDVKEIAYNEFMKFFDKK